MSQPQDNPILYNPTCAQLHRCLCSQASGGFAHISGQRGQPCVCKGVQLHDKGLVTIVPGRSLPMVTPMYGT